MPCFTPIVGYRSRHPNKNGRREIVFSAEEGFLDQKVVMGCGKCIGCLADRARYWGIRCANEASLWLDNSFITLTYDAENLPLDGSVKKDHVQKFLKRLRKKFPRHKSSPVRYFACGEYGTDLGRAHYHILLFNFWFTDSVYYRTTRQGYLCYHSAMLERLWPFGRSEIGSVTPESALYVAMYQLESICSGQIASRYVHPDTGEIVERAPEFILMSRNPGIGNGFWKKYREEIYRNDSLLLNGVPVKPPKYYDKLENEKKMEEIKRRRKAEQFKNRDNATPDRLEVRKKVFKSKLSTKRR